MAPWIPKSRLLRDATAATQNAEPTPKPNKNTGHPNAIAPSNTTAKPKSPKPKSNKNAAQERATAKIISRGDMGVAFHVKMTTASKVHKEFAVKLPKNNPNAIRDIRNEIDIVKKLEETLKKQNTGCIKHFVLEPTFSNAAKLTGKEKLHALQACASAAKDSKEDVVVPTSITNATNAHFMEYVPNSIPIDDFASRPNVNDAQRRSVMEQIERAFTCMFRAGFIHADAHVGNIIIQDPTNNPLARIIDFGRAMAVNPLRSSNSNITNWYHKATYKNPAFRKRATKTMETRSGETEEFLEYNPNIAWLNDKYTTNNMNVNGAMTEIRDIRKRLTKRLR